MSSTIQLRVDDELKHNSDNLFKDLGTDTSSAIRIFLTQAIACNGFPFEIKKTAPSLYKPLSEEVILKKLELSRKQASEGKVRDVNDVIADMRNKYEL